MTVILSNKYSNKATGCPFRVINNTENFALVFDEDADPLDLKDPFYYIVYLPTQKVEFATQSIREAQMSLSVLEETLQALKHTVVKPEVVPTIN